MNDRRFLTASLISFGVVLWLLLDLITPPTELTRFRNSLLAEVGEPKDFDWIPGSEPAGYKQETLAPPEIFVAVGQSLGSPDSDIVSMMKELVMHLRSKPKRRGPIKSTTDKAYRIIIQSGRGYCADYTQVFNGLAHSVRLPVREWGMSFDGFGGDGHAFSEVYDDRSDQWVFVDPLNAFFVKDRLSGRPLSVLEYRDRLTRVDGFQSINIVPIGNAFLFHSAREAFNYYRKGATQFYLWFGNDVFTYDQHPVVRFFGPVSRSVEQLVAISLGVHPTIRIVATSTNSSAIASLVRLRYQVISLTFVTCLIAIILFFQAAYWYRASRARRHS